MASEKLDVTATTDSYIKEVGGKGIDTGLQGPDLDLSPAETARGNVLERYINLWSIIYFSIIILCSWETVAITFQFALLNGGPSAMVYGCIFVGFGGSAVAFSMAEMASIDPAVGAQYRWSMNFAPCAPKFWGLIQGWLTVGAWIITCAGTPGVVANIIMGLVVFNNENYEPKPWHISLTMWALIVILFVSNLWFRQIVNAFELFGGIFHIVFFITSITTLAVRARHSPPGYVFNTLTTGVSGWNNGGVCWGIGLLTLTYSITGFDGILHMSDEVKKVRTRTPWSIVIATVSNAIMMFAFIICLLFTLGDLDRVTNTPTGVPLIEVYYQATNSKGATTFLVLMPTLVVFLAVFNVFASCSRLIWVFSKDKGLPFSKFFSTVHPKLGLPLNALGLLSVCGILLSVIYIISTTAFNAIVSLQVISLNISYIPPILFILLRKLRGQHINYGAFRLGRYGIAINLLALAYLIYIVTWIPFPTMLPVTGSNMNYAGPIFGVVIIAALLDWKISGHKRFQVQGLQTHDS